MNSQLNRPWRLPFESKRSCERSPASNLPRKMGREGSESVVLCQNEQRSSGVLQEENSILLEDFFAGTENRFDLIWTGMRRMLRCALNGSDDAQLGATRLFEPRDIMKTHRILLVDDHLLICQGVAALLCGRSDIVLAGQASTTAEALKILGEQPIDLVVTDISLNQCNGIDLVRLARTSGFSCHFIMLTAHKSPLAIKEAFHAGASGYVLKDDAFGQLVEVIDRVLAGETGLVSGHVSKEEIAGFDGLSAREREVLRLVALGMSNKQIGLELHLSVKTVETYRSRLMEKLNAHKSSDLVREALRAGIVDVNNP